jgi:hypothetical protein
VSKIRLSQGSHSGFVSVLSDIYFGDTYFQHDADVPYTNSPDKHDFDHLNDSGKASPISRFMAAGELTTASGAEVILFAVVFFPLRAMLGLW